MGPLTSTTSLAYLPSATSRATTTSTTIPPRTAAGPGGVFDTPKVKCPPDRGSSDCVRDSPASSSPPSPSTSPSTLSFSKSRYHPSKSIALPTINNTHSSPTRSSPRAIPTRPASSSATAAALSTPPLTPDSGSDCSSSSGSTSSSGSFTTADPDALDFLLTLFPQNGLQALPHAKRVAISAPNLGADFEGVVLHLPGKPKTLYVDGKGAAAVNLRESIVALLDLADESLGCNALVIVLERSSPNLSNLLHSLMYVGGTVVTAPVFKVDPAFVLVGMEI